MTNITKGPPSTSTPNPTYDTKSIKKTDDTTFAQLPTIDRRFCLGALLAASVANVTNGSASANGQASGPYGISTALTPLYPGLGHTNYQIGVYPMGNGVDEFLAIGYNDGGVTHSEPTAAIHFEIDWRTTAKGTANTRTMETYLQCAGAGDPGGRRPWFWSFYPADTSQGQIGEILYGYLSAGFNRYSGSDTSAGGGLTIWQDIGTESSLIAAFDKDGSRHVKLRSVPDIAAFASYPTTGSNMQFTAPAGHGLQPNSQIQIFQMVNDCWQDQWNTGSTTVTGTVTAVSGNTVTTNIYNSGAIVGTSFGWQIAIPNSGGSASNYHPSFTGLSINTAGISSAPYQLEVAGTVGVCGNIGITNRTGNHNATFYHGLLNFYSDPTTAPTLRQQLTFQADTVPPIAMGWTEAEYRGFCVGPAQATDVYFTAENSAFCIAPLFGNFYGVAIGGGAPAAERLRLAAGTSNGSQIFFTSSTLKSFPAVGDMAFDGSNLRFCKSAGTWSTVTIV